MSCFLPVLHTLSHPTYDSGERDELKDFTSHLDPSTVNLGNHFT